MPRKLRLKHPGMLAGVLLVALYAGGVLAERRPVLDQIDVPHDYYFREMYLPQLTTGPSSLAWMPDGASLVYSMQGSLWRQGIDSGVAVQLTAGPGYDFQPDVSPDGTEVVFVRYLADALELYILNLATGEVTPLTKGGAVNLEPRWSPDGTRLAFVSTEGTGRFHLFVGTLSEGVMTAAALFAERESAIYRYYYSSVDHELSPAWAPDGNSLFYVSNPEVPYGTGGIWQIALQEDSQPRLVRSEETSWNASPDIAPDGRRIAYASYLGRQWHQLWVTHADGQAEPFPLTYGDFDIFAPRWSPSGEKIAFVTNAGGDTGIRIQDFVGGRSNDLIVSHREFLAPMFDFDLRIVDIYGKPVAARVAVLGSDNRGYAPLDARLHADDAYDRDKGAFETKYFHTDGSARLQLPAGATRITVWRGPEHEIQSRLVNVAPGRDNGLILRVKPLDLPEEWSNWVSGDVHVHMNYGGTYRNTPADLVAQARAEDLDVVFNLIVNKEQRIPDIAYFATEPDEASDDDVLLQHAQEFHTSFWGHLGLLGLDSHLLLPDYSAYPGTAAASVFPDNTTIAKLAREQNAAVGYVHPFYWPPPDPATNKSLTSALPVDAALGLVDYYETVGFAHHRSSAAVWYRLLNCGARIAAAGGTDAMANYASLRGPVGLNRTYVRIGGEQDTDTGRRDAWIAALKAGASLATNGPLLALKVDGQAPGGEIHLPDRKQSVNYSGFFRSAVPVDHLELVQNGEVIETFEMNDARTSADISGSVTVDASGWLLLRAFSDGADPKIFDVYPYASTSPIYLTVKGEPPRSEEDAAYFLTWIDNLRNAVNSRQDFNSASELQAISTHLDQAQDYYEACRK
ncbi:MAG: CehA/McbA family metallohydrolase [Gammaproteobacteria bacterium]|nr:CehA/McbA family metallohydrolase [Gammaproteobacteria bacterium]